MSVVILGALAASTSAQAGFVTYTDLTLWQAAAGPATLEDFSGASVGVSTANFPLTSFNGFELSSVSNGDYSGIATGAIPGSNDAPPTPFNGQNYYGWGNGDGNVGPTSTFAFADGTTAFGFDWFNRDWSDSYSVTINGGGGTFVFPPFSYQNKGFWGIVATGGDSFTTASIQTYTYGGYIKTTGLDNVRVSVPVPEPGTLALFGLGFAGLCFVRRRKTA